MKKIKVRRIDQSPMNPRQWCIDLYCGHEDWITSNRRPKFKVMQCKVCDPNWHGPINP